MLWPIFQLLEGMPPINADMSTQLWAFIPSEEDLHHDGQSDAGAASFDLVGEALDQVFAELADVPARVGWPMAFWAVPLWPVWCMSGYAAEGPRASWKLVAERTISETGGG